MLRWHIFRPKGDTKALRLFFRINSHQMYEYMLDNYYVGLRRLAFVELPNEILQTARNFYQSYVFEIEEKASIFAPPLLGKSAFPRIPHEPQPR